jgi:hypothetical protein
LPEGLIHQAVSVVLGDLSQSEHVRGWALVPAQAETGLLEGVGQSL